MGGAIHGDGGPAGASGIFSPLASPDPHVELVASPTTLLFPFRQPVVFFSLSPILTSEVASMSRHCQAAAKAAIPTSMPPLDRPMAMDDMV